MSEKAPRRAKRVQRWTKEAITKELKNLERRLGRSPKSKDDMSLAQGAWKLFGSWNRAKKAAGLEAYPRGVPDYVHTKNVMIRKENEAEFLRAFDRPMTIRQLADKLGWPYKRILHYIDRLKWESGVRIAKVWLRLSSRGSVKFGAHELFDGLAAVQVNYLPDSQSHKVALADMLKKVIDKSPSKGKQCALTHHLKHELPPDVFEEVRKHYARAQAKEIVQGRH